MPRPVLLVPDARLKTPCAPVDNFGDSLRELVEELDAVRRANTGCVGIAACQIGEMLRVAIVDTSGHRKFGKQSCGKLILVNPRISEQSGERMGREGCLSLPDFTANVRRSLDITVQYRDQTGVRRELRATDFDAVALQHEIDHLDGILFLDRVANLNTDVFPRKK